VAFRSASASVTQSISDYSVQPATSSVSIKIGQSGAASFAVTPLGGFNSTVSFSCSGLPSGASCTFSPANLTLNGADVAIDTMTISTSGANSKTQRASRQKLLTGSGFAIAGLLMLLPVVSRKRRARLLSITGVLLMAAMWGCGGSSNSSITPTPPNPMAGTYTVTVSAASASGPSHTADITVTIAQ